MLGSAKKITVSNYYYIDKDLVFNSSLFGCQSLSKNLYYNKAMVRHIFRWKH